MKRFPRTEAFLRKLRAQSGFSLAEMLVCTIILLLSTTVIMETMSLAASQMQSRTRDSETNLLCGLLAQAAQNRLTCAVDCVTDGSSEGRVVSFRSTADGRPYELCSFEEGSRDGEIALVYTDEHGNSKQYDLIASANYTGSDGQRLFASLEVFWQDQRFSVELNVAPEQGGEPLASRSFIVYPVVK